ncbi:MAG: hypothetical protein JNN08_31135 [Bryobacterales bacterium]|nr:hypothetical protein [Bryobacterales bacterium]
MTFPDVQDPAAALDQLIGDFRRGKNYPALFEARLMKARFELGLPVIQTEDWSRFPDEQRRRYEEAFLDTAREVGQAFLDDGEIERAWPYFRAVGQQQPIIDAIDKLEPTEQAESAIGIAFQEGLHPRKGLELILARHGMCRAITAMGMYAVEKDREACITLLVRAIHDEVVQRLRRAIESQEGTAPPENAGIINLISTRDWLFGEYDTYVDTSHVMSVLQYAPELGDEATLRLVHELCAYGRRLSPTMQLRGTPPFDQPFVDYGHYVSALLGIDTEDALAALHRKVEETDPDEIGTGAAQMLVRLLVRLKRYSEALEVSLRYLSDHRASEMMCPSALEICRLAGDYARLIELAKDRGDILSYVAASIERQKQLTQS